MPYIHKGCGGQIKWFFLLPLPPRCTKCKKSWSPAVLYGAPPKDMTYISTRIEIKRHEDYAKWGDKIPYVGTVAGFLPKWPRWARILSFIIFLSIIGLIIKILFGG